LVGEIALITGMMKSLTSLARRHLSPRQ